MTIISYLTTIRFDFGAIAHLAEDVAAAGITRPMVVTDKGLLAAGVAEQALARLPRGAPVFDATPPNPTDAAAEAAAEMYRAHGCDGFVAVGGGSPMDLAKAAALLATHPGPLRQYALILGGAAKITGPIAPIVAVPTTSGTGSEVGRGAVISFADGRKMVIIAPGMIPRRAVCDPELTLGLPPGLTAATGMDALTHGVECFISPVENPPAGAIAFEGALRAAANIRRAVDNGKDRQARWEMMMASLMGAMAFQKGLGAVHAMSHALGGLKEVALHHGALNAVLLPAVLRFNAGSVGAKYEQLARGFGLGAEVGLDRFISELSREIGLPAGLSAMGVRREWLAPAAANAVEDHTTATNPRAVVVSQYRELLEESF
jgi:4-hydroxybutyrate dehydrogenase